MVKLLVYLILTVGLTGCPQKPPTDSAAKPAHAFALKSLQGETVEFQPGRKHLTVLHFWASWCPPCLDELPGLIAFAETVEKEGVEFVAVNLDPDAEAAKKVLPKKLPSNFKVLLDPELKTSEMYGSYQFPETFLVAKDFTLAMKWVGPQDWKNPEVRKLLESHR